ncbi:hypothetical protein M434DRAFT_31235 [Hypoxylon sp. CO27-5]|nr:hypothetical protein M434DRAFT_31235 [Hypoxylon sp. CO27-5]
MSLRTRHESKELWKKSIVKEVEVNLWRTSYLKCKTARRLRSKSTRRLIKLMSESINISPESALPLSTTLGSEFPDSGDDRRLCFSQDAWLLVSTASRDLRCGFIDDVSCLAHRPHLMPPPNPQLARAAEMARRSF